LNLTTWVVTFRVSITITQASIDSNILWGSFCSLRGEIMEKKKEITAIYAKDSNRYHRDLIDEG